MSVTISSDVKVLAPVCDKFAAVLSWGNPEEWCSVVDSLVEMSKKVNAKRFHSKIYEFAYRFDTGGSDVGRLVVQANPIYSGVAYLRVEWNPRRADAIAVIDILNKIVPGGYAGVFKGICTRLDVAVDLIGVDIEQLVVWSTHARVTRSFSRNGRLQTYYLGAKSGRTMFAIYDRIAATAAPQSSNLLPITRIEVRSRKRFALAYGTNGVGLLFHRLSVCNYPPASTDLLFQCFLDSCRFRGTLGALQRLDTQTRKKMEARLKLYAVPWWNPQSIAKAVPGLLKALSTGVPVSS